MGNLAAACSHCNQLRGRQLDESRRVPGGRIIDHYRLQANPKSPRQRRFAHLELVGHMALAAKAAALNGPPLGTRGGPVIRHDALLERRRRRVCATERQVAMPVPISLWRARSAHSVGGGFRRMAMSPTINGTHSRCCAYLAPPIFRLRSSMAHSQPP